MRIVGLISQFPDGVNIREALPEECPRFWFEELNSGITVADIFPDTDFKRFKEFDGETDIRPAIFSQDGLVHKLPGCKDK